MDVDYDDPEELEICPYDPVHRIRRKRFPYHLVKCRKNHLSQQFKTCPFNARHVIPTMELNYHIRVCPDRSVVERRLEKVDYIQKGNTEVPSYNLEWNKPVASESWDDDDYVVQPKSSGRSVSNADPVQPHPHLNGTTQHSGPLDQQFLSMRIETAQLPKTAYHQPGMPQSYPGGLVNGTTQHPLMKQTLPGTGVVGGTVQLGRGRGRGLFTPARQPNTSPAPIVSAAIGRGISSFTNNFMGAGMELRPSLPELPQTMPLQTMPLQMHDPIRNNLPDHLRDLSDDELKKRARKLAKMLRQIEKLEQARDNGEAIDPDQVRKIERKPDVIEQLDYLKPLNLLTSS